MSSRVLAGLLVAGCLTAAGGGAYVAVRQNAAASAAPAQSPATPSATDPSARPVSETEAVVGGAEQAPPSAKPVTASPADPTPARTETAHHDAPENG